jgi:hypothetical protein
MNAGITVIKGAVGTTNVLVNLDLMGLALGGGTLSLTGASLMSMN